MRLARPFGGLSVRKLLLLVAGVLAALFSFIATPVSAQATFDAEWKGDTQIVYDGNTYSRGDDGTANDPRGIPEGSIVFVYADGATLPSTMHYIYFPSGKDPNTADNAQYSSAKFDDEAAEGEQYSDISEAKFISLEPHTVPATTSCNQEGIGYIVCPVTNWLARGMDTLYSLISGFLEVRPPQTNTENALYRAWSMMRNFANVIFVIAFLVIIYSQITTFGISNYNIKKMLPRLVIAAILVNISYWICAIAIDVSNILGYSIQDILMNIRENLVGPEGNSWDSAGITSWQSVSSAVLAAGVGVTALTIGGVAFATSGGGAIFLLLPILLGVIMAVLIALLIMAARQAIITILLVISPLAFVAFLLPNTEKYFEKWRGLGTTMLLMFPIFSMIFGGAQLAGAIIIQHADSVSLLILGLAVQVAPLVITPLLIRFSGSVLGRIAGMVNNPNKGLIDRTRKWSQERADMTKSRQIAKGQNWLANRARNIDNRRRNREGRQKAHDAMSEANWSNTAKASDIQQYAMRAADIKQIGDSNAQARFNASKATNTEMQDLDLKARAAKLSVDMTSAKIDTNWEEVLAGDTRNIVVPENLSVQALSEFARGKQRFSESLRDQLFESKAETRRGQAAQGEQSLAYAQRLKADPELRRRAAGIDVGGEAKVEAAAWSEITEAKNKTLAASVGLLEHRALEANMSPKGFSKKIVADVHRGAVTGLSPIEIEAAYDYQAKEGQIALLEEARLSGRVDQEMLSRVFARNADVMKAKGGYHLQDAPGLAYNPKVSAAEQKIAMDRARAASLGDVSADSLKSLKQGWVEQLADTDNLRDIMNAVGPENADLKKAYNSIYQALNTPQIRATINDKEEYFIAIEKMLREEGNYTPYVKTNDRQQQASNQQKWRGPRRP